MQETPFGPLKLPPPLNADILAFIADAVICTDQEGRILVFNPAAEASFGYRADEVIGQPVEMLLPTVDRAEHVLHVRRFALGAGVTQRLMGRRREVWGRRKSGEIFPSEAMVSRQTIEGRVILTVVHRDITERKEVETLREAAARELDHRMRNLLSVVNSIVSISAASAESVEDFRESLTRRLAALAATQSVLRFGERRCASLNELFLTELAQYQTRGGANVHIEGPPVSIGPKAAQLLTLAVHELATNSAKYGAFRNADGRVDVTVERDGDLVVIRWKETGGPPVTKPMRKGFGTRLVKQIVAKALHAEVAMDYRPEGLVCRMTLTRATIEADQESPLSAR